MTRLFMTGFESGGLEALSAYLGHTPYSGVEVSTVQKRTGAYSLLIDAVDEYANCYVAEATVVHELYLRFGLYPTGYSTTGRCCLLVFRDQHSPSETAPTIAINADTNLLEVCREGGGNLLATSSEAIVLNTWTCIEIYLHQTKSATGRVVVKFNGRTVVDYTGSTMNGSYEDVVQLIFGDPPNNEFYNYPNAVVYGYFDDIAINDINGTINKSWIGQGGIIACQPNGAGNVTELTPSAGANYTCVDDIPASDSDDVTAIITETPPAGGYTDLYTLDTSGIPTGVTVSAVKLSYRAKNEVGAENLKPVVRSGSTTEVQTAIALGASFASKQLILNADPIDDIAWTRTKLLALQAGMQLNT